MYSKKILWFVLVTLIFLTGCAKNREGVSPEDRVIAKVNNYELTVGDFKEGLKTTVAQKNLSADPANAKKEILEELITRKVLVQEAQKSNFDKERSFMREIERYWEQALIKLLLKKKLQEISGMIRVSPDEIVKEYDVMKSEVPAGKLAEFPALEKIEGDIRDTIIKRKKEAAMEEWVDGLRKKAAVTIDQKALDSLTVK